MPFEERFALLCERAQRDYGEYISAVGCMDGPSIVKEAKKLTMMEEILSQIKDGYFDHPFDVELLLYYAHPLLAAYGQWEQGGGSITAAVNENVNEFLAKTRNQLAEMQAGYDTLAPGEQDRIMEYHNRHLAVFDYLQDNEIWEKKLSELMECVDRDYEGCQIYIRNCVSLDGEYPADFASITEAIYQRMKTYGYTNEQLTAINHLSNPISSVYFAFKKIMPHGSPDESTIDRAIAITAGADRSAEQENSAEESMGRDDDGLDK